jgi:hypothetical protein
MYLPDGPGLSGPGQKLIEDFIVLDVAEAPYNVKIIERRHLKV